MFVEQIEFLTWVDYLDSGVAHDILAPKTMKNLLSITDSMSLNDGSVGFRAMNLHAPEYAPPLISFLEVSPIMLGF
jgi:hypothetical protein